MKLSGAIEEECLKLIARYHSAASNKRLVQRRFTRATGEPPPRSSKVDVPVQWAIAPWFNPFKVRGRADVMAKAIEDKLRDGTYLPRPALVIQIPKPVGGARDISIFSVADAAVANAYYKQIVERNQSRMSPYSYAYRSDLSIHDAIERLWREVRRCAHYFLVEFDFSKYFDTIDHAYVTRVLHSHFKLTRVEHKLVQSILRSRRAFGGKNYLAGRFSECTRGIPQGNSLSLFLANVACHELDLELGREGLTFARYADDIVVLCTDYGTALAAREHIMNHCAATGLVVNFQKSEGITEFGPHGLKGNSTTRSHFDFVGHRFSYRLVHLRGFPSMKPVRRLSIREARIRRLRAKLGSIIHSHLLRYPEEGFWKAARVDLVAKIDWDLVTCINDLRGYIYGGMSEAEIQAALGNRMVRLHRSSGIMAFFPLITDVEQLRLLDGWLLNALRGALERRRKLLIQKFGLASYPSLRKDELIDGDWYSMAATGILNSVKLPSILRAWKYSRRGLSAFGLRQFPSRLRTMGDEDLY